jgi:peptide-methionine (S)-S-oxide reductase
METAVFGMGCFWGAERRFWTLPGIYTTAVGYAGGHTANQTYEAVCSGRTGHAEVVLVVFDPGRIDYRTLLRCFWESHNPTQGMRQGNDVGTQYRSCLLATSETQQAAAEASRHLYDRALGRSGYERITTDIGRAELGLTQTDGRSRFFYAEGYHQQYLAKNPNGYCGLGGTGVPCPDL